MVYNYDLRADGWPSVLALAVVDQMQCSSIFKGAYDAVYNNCQSFVILLVREILRNKDTVQAQGFTEIMPLTPCYYEHLRTEETHIYFKEIPQIIKAHPKIVVENLKYLFSHPS